MSTRRVTAWLREVACRRADLLARSLDDAVSPRRVTAWLLEVARRRADDVVAVPGGVAVLSGRFPSAHDHNQLLLWDDVDAVAVSAAADEVLGGAGLSHRRMQVLDAQLADRLDPGLRELGYARENELLLWRRPGQDPVGAVALDGPAVVELGLPERVAAATAGWAREQPGWPVEVARQLGERIATALSAADVTFLGIREGDRVVARADLFVHDGVAQIEEVMTEPAARNRGYASALVREGVSRAGGPERGADLVFLVADADDWPAVLYRRLGFEDLGRTASFRR